MSGTEREVEVVHWSQLPTPSYTAQRRNGTPIWWNRALLSYESGQEVLRDILLCHCWLLVEQHCVELEQAQPTPRSSLGGDGDLGVQ